MTLNDGYVTYNDFKTNDSMYIKIAVKLVVFYEGR